VHCAAIPETLFEAELFGYERGAFTNAFVSHRGYFEQASGGTIFLDEVSEIPEHFQVKLLRVLEEKHLVRLGGEKPIPVGVRIIAASQQPLAMMLRQK
jgi:Nif-specific regulatory protein